MKKILRIVLSAAVCILAALPFLILGAANLTAEPYPPLPSDSLFQIASVLYLAEFCAAAVVLFLLYVRLSADPKRDTAGCGLLALSGVSVFCMWKLCDFGEGVKWNRFFDSFCRSMHPGWSGFVFSVCLTIPFITIMISTAALISGALSGD